MRENFHDDNNVNIMVQSGARGNWMQIRQIAGMRGLVANPKGEIIPRPVKSNYREGLSVLEYFISQHGARQGSGRYGTAYRESGYLTPSSRGRLPGDHRARRGLRHHARSAHDRCRA